MYGKIELIIGPMFSGKTSELMKRINRLSVVNHKCIVIKYCKDNRYSNSNFIFTHDKINMYAVNTDSLLKLKDMAENYTIIGIDEGQFFEDIVDFCETMANMNKIVIVAGLDATFERKPFGKILDLIPLSESVIKLSAICKYCCKNIDHVMEASFSKRLIDDKSEILIGGSDLYTSVCRQCYFDNKLLLKFNDAINKESPK